MNISQTRMECEPGSTGPEDIVFQQDIIRRVTEHLLQSVQALETTSFAAQRFAAASAAAPEVKRTAVLLQPPIQECLSRAPENQDDHEARQRTEHLLAEAAEALEGSPAAETALFGKLQIPSEFRMMRVWDEEWRQTAGGQYFDELFRKQVARAVHFKPVTLAEMTADQTATFQQGWRILHEVLPSVAKIIHAHIQLVALIDYESAEDRKNQKQRDFNVNILTQPLAGTILLSPPALDSPYRAAEFLLREGLGRVFSDLNSVDPFFIPEALVGPAKTVPVIWNRGYQWRVSSRNPNSWAHPSWTVERALGALFGFVHMAAFFDVLSSHKEKLEATYGPMQNINRVDGMKAAAERAAYLIRELKEVGAPELAPSGYQLINRLTELLTKTYPTAFDVAPDLSLYLDRFDNDTVEVASIIDHIPNELATIGDWNADAAEETWPLVRLVNQLIQNEIATGHTLLYAIYQTGEYNSAIVLDRGAWSARASVKVPFPQLAKYFHSQRQYVSAMLRTALTEAGATAPADWHKHAISYLTSDINDYSIKCVPLLAVRKKNLMG